MPLRELHEFFFFFFDGQQTDKEMFYPILLFKETFMRVWGQMDYACNFI